MSEDKSAFDHKEIAVVKGFEARARAKWETQGWEFVSQDSGTIRTKIAFRRPKPKTNWLVVGGLTGLVAALIGFSLLMGSLEGDGPEESGTDPSTSPSTSAPQVDTPIPETLTIENNEDFAALLSSEGGEIEMYQEFFDKYSYALIEFDANIAYMANHGDYENRFDVLVYADDYSETTAIGPPFRVLDVNYNDFNLIGPDVPDSIMMGMNVRIVGKIVEWEDPSFTLEIVSTKVR